MADGRRATREQREEQILVMLKRIWNLPLSGVRDLAGYGDLAPPHINSLLAEATRLDLVGCIRGRSDPPSPAPLFPAQDGD